jgi:hypothetical protein
LFVVVWLGGCGDCLPAPPPTRPSLFRPEHNSAITGLCRGGANCVRHAAHCMYCMVQGCMTAQVRAPLARWLVWVGGLGSGGGGRLRILVGDTPCCCTSRTLVALVHCGAWDA